MLVILPATGSAQDLAVERRVEDLLSHMTREEKIDMIGGYDDFFIRPNARLGIPAIKMADGPLGVRNYGKATALPAGIALAATWNPELMNAVGHAVGKEARARGVHIMLAPGVNIYRAPMCGRNFEYFGEDPYLASRMTVAYISGVQQEGVVATVKHYAANNQEWDRHTVSSNVDDRTLHEIYFPAFRAAVEEAHVGAVMTSYNLVNGVHASQNDYLIRDVLKREWKFDGFVMSDWVSTYDAVAAANGGLDLEMPSGQYLNRANLLPALKNGEVQQATIDDKVRRMLRVMVRMGFLDRPQQIDGTRADSATSRRTALEAAREGIVLLKNEDEILPLDRKEIHTLAVIGPNAHPAVTGAGGSSLVRPNYPVSPRDGVSRVAGHTVRVVYEPGVFRVGEEDFEKSEFWTTDPRDPGTSVPGLQAEYYRTIDLSGEPVARTNDRTVNFRWTEGPGHGLPQNNYAVRWTGWIQPGNAKKVLLVVRGDDGYRLRVNGKPVLDAWADQPATTRTTWVDASAGERLHVVLEYYQRRGDAEIRFGWLTAAGNELTKAVEAASKADAVVICAGFNAETEGEGFDRPFALPAEQVELIKAIASANPKTIVALNAGGNVEMSQWLTNVPVLLHTWYPGQEGGTALAEILFGDVNPSGKLPATFERRWEDNATYASYHDTANVHLVQYSEGVFLGYRHMDAHGIEPLFPFGYGLSYTSFEYANLRISSQRIEPGQGLTVTFDVQNTGPRRGKEIAQIYVADFASSVPRPPKELKRFAKVDLAPGEVKTVTVHLQDEDLAHFDVSTKGWVTEPGEYKVIVGSSSRLSRFTAAFRFN
jgi:beta-glucosidase